MVFVGVDGGGTKTAAVVVDKLGAVLGNGLSGSSNPNSVGDKTASENLIEAIKMALMEAHHEVSDIEAIALCMAGVNRSQDVLKVKSWMYAAGLSENVKLIIKNDAFGALSSGTEGVLNGIVVISGTGSIIFGVRDNLEVSASGCGPMLGDGGSGFAIASSALSAVCRSHDGRGPLTLLKEVILSHLKLDMDGLIGWAYSDLSWARFAALAPLVLSLYAKDEVATKIINDHINELFLGICAVVSRLYISSESFEIVFSGGILHDDNIRRELSKIIIEKFPLATIVSPKVSAELGSALIALKSHSS